MICPQCRSTDCFRSHRRGFADLILGATGILPWRCRTCDKRFYARRVAMMFLRYAHCPRCGNFDLERISRERVEDGMFLGLWRFLGLPAFRCDPCRTRFFSVRRHRRILPAMLYIPREEKVAH